MNDTSTVFDDDQDDDRRTFAPSPANRDVLEQLVGQGHFKTSIGAFQAAALMALRLGLNTDNAPPASGTMWNRGSVNLSVLEFLSWYVPTNAPVRALALLGNVGLEFISEKVSTGGYSLTEIFEIGEIEID